MSTDTKETVFAIFFLLWLALAIATLFFYRRRDFAFRKRWHAYVYAFHVVVLGTPLLLITVPNWPAFAVFAAMFLFFIWLGFRTRVCLTCGKISAPEKVIVPVRFCSRCGTSLRTTADASPQRTRKWPRGARLIAGLVAIVGFGAAALMFVGFLMMGHKRYHVNGSIRISSPGPSNVELPAVACMWADSHGVAHPATVRAPDEESRTAYVICRIPEDGVGIPFHVTEYSNTGHGLLIGAFLRPLRTSHLACSDPRALAVLVSDPNWALSAVCEKGPLPPKSETALMAPFDDNEGRPTGRMRIDIYRAE